MSMLFSQSSLLLLAHLKQLQVVRHSPQAPPPDPDAPAPSPRRSPASLPGDWPRCRWELSELGGAVAGDSSLARVPSQPSAAVALVEEPAPVRSDCEWGLT